MARLLSRYDDWDGTGDDADDYGELGRLKVEGQGYEWSPPARTVPYDAEPIPVSPDQQTLDLTGGSDDG